MATFTLAELVAFERKLIKAMADPTRQVWYDDFRKENRPFSEIAQQLSWVRGEIARHPDTVRTGAARSKFLAPRNRSGL